MARGMDDLVLVTLAPKVGLWACELLVKTLFRGWGGSTCAGFCDPPARHAMGFPSTRGLSPAEGRLLSRP